ncbi:MAG: hypothetical protein V3U10_06415 [Bacteroidota bacterium]
MHVLALILNAKARTFFQVTFDYRHQTIIKNVASFLIFVGFAVAAFFFARSVTAYMLAQAKIGLFLFHHFISMLLYVFFVSINLGNMVVCYATLYKSKEVQFLFTQPISHAKIFIVKFLDNFFYSSTTLFLVGFSVLLGYGSYFDMPWTYHLFVMFFVLVPFMLIAALLAAIVLMLLLQLGARISFKRLIAGLVLLYIGSVYAYFKVTAPFNLVAEVMKYYPDVNRYFGNLDPPVLAYMPNHWIAEILFWIQFGDVSRVVPYFALLMLTCIGLLVISVLLARKIYYRTWLITLGLRFGSGDQRTTSRRFFDFPSRSIFPSQTEMLLKKDFWSFFREPSQWVHLSILLILMVIFVVSLTSLDLKLTIPFLQTVSYLVVLVFNGFLVASIALRFVYPMISLEGESFWSIRSAPVNLNLVYGLKLAVSMLFIMALAEVLAVLSNLSLRDDPALVKISMFAVFWVSLGLVSLSYGGGGYFASYKERNPIRIASSQGASLTFLVSLFFLVVVVAILFIPLNRYFEYLIFEADFSFMWFAVPLVLIMVLSLATFVVLNLVGSRSLRRDF